MKDLSKHFLNKIKTRSIEKFSAKIKPPYILLSAFCYLLCVYRGIPFFAMFPSFLVCWKNLDQFLPRQSFVNHPTMTVKFGKFYCRSPGNFPGTSEVNMMNVLYFLVIYRLYLNYNTKLAAERQVINYRHKILKQCYSSTDFLSENFLLEKSKELLKINLVFRACLLAESLLLKLNRPWLCASNLIISTKTWRKTPIDESILRKCRLLLE